MSLIKNLGKHSSTSSNLREGIHAILTCIKESDVHIKEVALQAIISFLRQDSNLSQIVVNSGINFKNIKIFRNCYSSYTDNAYIIYLYTYYEHIYMLAYIYMIMINN